MLHSPVSTQPDLKLKTAPADWLNRNVVGMGLTSLLSDACHEMATAVLPGFLAVLGVPAVALGAIEGVADSLSSFVKLASGWLSDRLGRRKPITVAGYFLTGIATGFFAIAHGWALVLAARVVGWFGRGVRGPLRNALLAESVPAETRGRAFGFHRGADTLGAILGPLIAVALLAFLHDRTASADAPFRIIFLVTLVPGLGAGAAFAALVSETRHEKHPTKFWLTLKNLPKPFRRFLVGVGIFGIGDFARSLMILAATELLAPTRGLARAAQIAGLLYVAHNIFYAGFTYPLGALSDRWGRRGLLALGYGAGALSALGLLLAFYGQLRSVAYLAAVFALAGASIAAADSLEGASTADLVPAESRGTAYGVLGTVNGVGDLVSSVLVGALWTAFSPALAFGYAAGLMALGGAVLYASRQLSVVRGQA